MEKYVKSNTIPRWVDWLTNGKVYQILDDEMFDYEDGYIFGNIVDDDGDKIIVYTASPCKTQGLMYECDDKGNKI